MSLSDPIADMLTRIRNGGTAGMKEVLVRASKICEGVAKVLVDEGYVLSYDRIDDNKQGLIRVELKYTVEGDPVISEIQRVSKPGRRVYSEVKDMPKVLDGLGITIVSTSKGIMSDRCCRKENAGGELLCTVS